MLARYSKTVKSENLKLKLVTRFSNLTIVNAFLANITDSCQIRARVVLVLAFYVHIPNNSSGILFHIAARGTPGFSSVARHQNDE